MLSFDESGASARCAMSMVVADAPIFVGSNSGEPTSAPGKVDDQPCAGSYSDELAMTSSEIDGSSAAGNSSDELVGKADGLPNAGTRSDELAAPRDELEDRLSTGTSSGESDTVSSSECSLSDLKLSFSRTGIVALGDNEGDEGGLDSCLLTDAFEFEQLRLMELPLKALCAVPGVSNLEEDFNFSNSGLGEEESSPIPLLSITPFGSPLTVENCDMEAVGSESTPDTSRWVKNRLPGFCKLVGLPMNRHEKL